MCEVIFSSLVSHSLSDEYILLSSSRLTTSKISSSNDLDDDETQQVATEEITNISDRLATTTTSG